MSASLNKVMLIGNLGGDPEVRFTEGGQAVANFSIATNESWKDKAGEKQERTEWHRIVVWGKLAELCGEHLRKGRTVFAEGRIQTRAYTGKQGAQKLATEIVADRVVFLSAGAPKGKEEASPAAPDGMPF